MNSNKDKDKEEFKPSTTEPSFSPMLGGINLQNQLDY